MVDMEVLLKVASQRAGSQRGEHRKVDLILNELDRYGVVVAALQETR